MLGSKCLPMRRPRGWRGAASRESSGAFTLIEILIVISIISLLASLVVAGIQLAKIKAYIGIARTEVAGLATAVGNYALDEAEVPGKGLAYDPERNDFPLLFKALFGERRPRGPGGRSAPYGSFQEGNVAVRDADLQGYRKALRREIQDDGIPKYILDPWGNPYVYRATGEGGSKVCRREFVLYSLGPNGIDDVAAGSEDPDDIGSW